MKNLFSRIEKGRVEEDSSLKSPFTNVKYNGILNQMVNDGELPPSEKVLDAIRKKEITAEDAKAKWLEFKKGEAEVIGNTKGNINKPEDVKTIAKSDIETFSKVQSKGGVKPQTPEQKAQQQQAQQQPGGVSAEEAAADERPMMSEGYNGIVKDQWFMYRKYLSGLSLGIYEGPEEEAPSDLASWGGTVADLTGAIASFTVAGWGITGGLAKKGATGALSKGVPFVGKAIKNLRGGSEAAAATMKYAKVIGEPVKFGTKVAKHGKAAGALALEGATLFGGIGVAKSKIKGESWSDAFAQGVVDGTQMAAASAVLYPVVAGAGALFGKREINKLKKVYGHLKSDEITSRIKNMGVDDLVKLYEKVPAAARSEEYNVGLMALKKIKAIRPEGGPLLASELARTPEIAMQAIKQESKSVAEKLISNEGAPLKFMYDSSEALRTMMNSGDHVGSLAMVKPMMMDAVKQASTIGDLATLPFRMNAKQSHRIAAGRSVRNLEGKGIKGVDRGLFTDFFSDPSRANLQALKEAVPDAAKLRQAMGVSPKSYMNGSRGVQDIRINSKKAAEIADDYLETYFKTINTDGAISFGDIGKINEANGILKSATVMNKQFSLNMLKASSRHIDRDLFVSVKPHLKDGVKDRIKLRSLVIDTADDLNTIKSLKNEIANIADDATPELIDRMKITLKNSQASFSRKMRSMRELDSLVSGFSKEDTKAIDGLVSKIFAPTKNELGMSSKQTTEYMKRFGYADNPLYLKNGTDLADMMSMMVAGGKDVGFSQNEPWMKEMLKPIGTRYFAPIQRKLRTHFGYNNPLEVMFNGMKHEEIQMKATKKLMMDGLAKTGIARNSKASNITMQLVEENISRSSDEFLALSPEIQKKAIAASEYIKPQLDKYFGYVNEAREAVGLKPFTYRQNYMHHARKGQTLKEAAKERIVSSTPAVQEAGSKVGKVGPQVKGHVKEVPSKLGHHQTAKEGYVVDAVESFDQYLDAALEVIHFSRPVRELEAVAGMAPAGIQKILNHVKETVFAKAANPFDKATETLVKRGLELTMRKRAEGLILGNVNVLFQQLSSGALSLVASPRDAITATVKMFSKEYDELFKLSRNRQLAAPLEFVNFEKNLMKSGEGALQSTKAGYNYMKHFMSYGFKKFDAVARKHMFTAACEHWKRSGGRELALANKADPLASMMSYADDWVDIAHGSFGKLDKPEILKSAMGRAMMQFQSFTNNLATTMMYDMPRMAYKDGAYKVSKNLLEAGAAMSIINEVCAETGIPKPFSFDMFIPFVSNYRYANSGVGQAMYDYAKETATGDGRRKGAATRGLVSAGASVAFPGSKQVYKGSQAFGRITSKRGRLTFDTKGARKYNKPMAMLFGSYPQYEKEKERKIAKSPSKGSPFQKAEKKAKRYVKRKLFK